MTRKPQNVKTTTRGIAIALVEAVKSGHMSARSLTGLISKLDDASQSMGLSACDGYEEHPDLARNRADLMMALQEALEYEYRERITSLTGK